MPVLGHVWKVTGTRGAMRYGGMIGADLPARADLRFGGFIGGGQTRSDIDLNTGATNSDLIFGGI